MSVIRAPALPRLSTVETQYASVLARSGGVFDCAVPAALAGAETSTHWRIAFAPEPQAAADAVPAGLRVRWRWGGFPFCLLIPETAVDIWMQSRFPGLDCAALPAAWQESAPTLLIQCILNALREIDSDVLPVPCAHEALHAGLDGAGPSPSDGCEGSHRWQLSASSRQTGCAFEAAVYFNADALSFFVAQLMRLPPRDFPSLRAVPVTLSALIGRSEMTLADLQSLCVGDVILLDDYADPQADEHWLMTAGGDAICIRPCPRGGTVTQPWKHFMSFSISAQPVTRGVIPGASTASPGTPQRTRGDAGAAPASDYDASMPFDDPFGLHPADAAFDDAYGAQPPLLPMEETPADDVDVDEPGPEPADIHAQTQSAPSGLAMSGMGSGYSLLSEQGMPLDPRHIGVQLVFDVGEYHVPLCDLLALRPGAVIDLGRTFSTRTVRIRSAGRAIGQGELVEVDGCVGVRITRWSGEAT